MQSNVAGIVARAEMTDLQNRVAPVTGASRGIGAGIAVALARAGADVAVNFRERAEAAKAVCSEITAMGRQAITVQADVSVSAEVKRMVAEVEQPLDILINNAAVAYPRKFEHITEEERDQILTANLKSVFLLTQAVSQGCENASGAASSICLRWLHRRAERPEHTMRLRRLESSD